jgi:hypothetical protein
LRHLLVRRCTGTIGVIRFSEDTGVVTDRDQPAAIVAISNLKRLAGWTTYCRESRALIAHLRASYLAPA